MGEEPDVQQFPDLVEIRILLQHLQREVELPPRLAEESLVPTSETRPVIVIRKPRQGVIAIVVVVTNQVGIDNLAIMKDVSG